MNEQEAYQKFKTAWATLQTEDNYYNSHGSGIPPTQLMAGLEVAMKDLESIYVARPDIVFRDVDFGGERMEVPIRLALAQAYLGYAREHGSMIGAKYHQAVDQADWNRSWSSDDLRTIYQKLVTYCHKAIQLENFPGAHSELARHHLIFGEKDKAIEEFQKVVNLDPHGPAGAYARQELADLQGKKGGCFIATAAYGSAFEPDVVFLRSFRDDCLLPTRMGCRLVGIYETISPPLAAIISKHDWLCVLTRRCLLSPLIWVVKRWLHKG
jgi:tetratricopeptide (TPR) repeat protein